MRTVELFEQGRSHAEITRAVGIHPESVRRWKRLWEQGGAQASRRRPAAGRPPKLDDAQVGEVRGRIGAWPPRRTDSRPTCGPWSGWAWRSNG
ncbi:helix-turn-helix domain-containing protein [Streptomyces olivoreticuli]